MGNISNPEQWSTRERLRFIERTAFWRATLKREDLADVFSVSVQQCSADLKRFQGLCPGALEYNTSRRRYEGSKKMKCKLHTPNLEDAMATFLGDTGTWLSQPSAMAGGKPGAVARVDLPVREAKLDVQRRVFLAVLWGKRIRVNYHSLSSGEATWRWIRPHAFGHDGYRWHLRSWCENNEEYRDFVLSRVRAADWPEAATSEVPADVDWHTLESLELEVNPKLSAERQAAIAEDFGLKGGKLVLKVRKALLSYTLEHLRLPGSGISGGGKPFLILK